MPRFFRKRNAVSHQIAMGTIFFRGFVFSAILCLLPAAGDAIIHGPLTVSEKNPRYFSDPNGNIVYLTGSHTWANLQDMGRSDPPPAFDYRAYLDFLKKNNHNFFRLWVWEQAKWLNVWPGPFYIDPLPFARTGPGVALDGKPRFDLTRFNEAYFARLRRRVLEAHQQGIYVAVMLFNGWSTEKKPHFDRSNPWDGHPFNRHNNINGIDADLNGDGSGKEAHSLVSADVVKLQRAYVTKVIDAVNDLPNVLWEISNESPFESTEWQFEMIRFIKNYQKQKPMQHPVGMTVTWPDRDRELENRNVFESPADWVSPKPSPSMPLKTNPPPASKDKVVLLDTDHIWGTGGNRVWVWKSMLRGYNPIYMDPYDIYEELTGKVDVQYNFQNPSLNLLRRTMGYTRSLADRVGLHDMQPEPKLASTGYCLASNPLSRPRLLVYLPKGRKVRLDLRGYSDLFQVEWIHPVKATTKTGGKLVGGAHRDLVSPFWGDSLLYLYVP